MDLVIILSIVFAVFTAFSVFFRKAIKQEKKKDEQNKKVYICQKILFYVFYVCFVFFAYIISHFLIFIFYAWKIK